MQTVRTFITEHKKAITIVAALGIGLSVTRYILSEDATESESPKLIALNETETDPSTVFLFAHGIDPRASVAISQPTAYIKNGAIDSTCYTFSFNDSVNTLNFGQERDCKLLLDAYTQVQQKHPHASIVLIGISRGASTIINMLAQEQGDWSPVKAVILESPFMSVDSLIEHISNSYTYYVPYGKNMLQKIIYSLPLYNPYGIQTINMIPQFPQQIPVFIGYSTADKTVAPGDAQTIIALLQNQGNKVTTYMAENARHSTLGTHADYCKAVRLFLFSHVEHIVPPTQ